MHRRCTPHACTDLRKRVILYTTAPYLRALGTTMDPLRRPVIFGASKSHNHFKARTDEFYNILFPSILLISRVAWPHRFSPQFARERLARLRSRMNVELVKKFISPGSGKLTVVPPSKFMVGSVSTQWSYSTCLRGPGRKFTRAGEFGRVSDPVGSEGACLFQGRCNSCQVAQLLSENLTLGCEQG